MLTFEEFEEVILKTEISNKRYHYTLAHNIDQEELLQLGIISAERWTRRANILTNEVALFSSTMHAYNDYLIYY